jgi:hypothetical protein
VTRVLKTRHELWPGTHLHICGQGHITYVRVISFSLSKKVTVQINAWRVETDDRRPPPSTCAAPAGALWSPHTTAPTAPAGGSPHPTLVDSQSRRIQSSGSRRVPRAHLGSSSSARRGRPSRHLHLRPEPPTSAPPHHSSPAPAVTCRRRPPGRGIVGPEHGRLRVSKGEIRSRPSPTSRGTASLTSFPFFPFGCVLDCARNVSGAVMWKRSESL